MVDLVSWLYFFSGVIVDLMIGLIIKKAMLIEKEVIISFLKLFL